MRLIPVVAYTHLDQERYIQLGGIAHVHANLFTYLVNQILTYLKHQFIVHLQDDFGVQA
ncbi:hypothetical protein D3C86_2242190 [compost metagenome]